MYIKIFDSLSCVRSSVLCLILGAVSWEGLSRLLIAVDCSSEERIAEAEMVCSMSTPGGNNQHAIAPRQGSRSARSQGRHWLRSLGEEEQFGNGSERSPTRCEIAVSRALW